MPNQAINSYAFLKILLLLLAPFYSTAQQLKLNLQEAITMAQRAGIPSKINSNNAEIGQYQYKYQVAQGLPQLSLNANLPGYTSSITSVTQPDGTIRFTSVEQAFSSASLNLSQRIQATGGTISMSSALNRFDRFSSGKRTNWQSQPLLISFSQPLLRFNEMKWNLHVARLNKKASEQIFSESQEAVALQVTQQYYLALQGKMRLQLAEYSSRVTDTLLQMADEKLKLGKIGEDEYLMIQLQLINSRNALGQARLNDELNCTQLCLSLNIDPKTKLELDMSSPLSNGAFNNQYTPELEQILRNAMQNRSDVTQQMISQRQAEAGLKRASLARLPGLTLTASYGTNQSALALHNAYRDLLNQKNISMGISMPLFSSGANKANYYISRLQMENQRLQNSLFDKKLQMEIQNNINQHNLSRQSLLLNLQADSIAARRFNIALNRYKAGKTSYSDFFMAQQQKEQARISLIVALQEFWSSYYLLRKNSLQEPYPGGALPAAH